jgi:hypothetical protein
MSEEWQGKEIASFDEVLAFCNKVREIGGANPLDALIPAIPQDSHQCLVALNLNFSCRVTNGTTARFSKYEIEHQGYGNVSYYPWTMIVDDPVLAIKLGKGLDLPVIGDSNNDDGFVYHILLPAKIGAVARRFDDWMDDPEADPEMDKFVEESTRARVKEHFDALFSEEEQESFDEEPDGKG